MNKWMRLIAAASIVIGSSFSASASFAHADVVATNPVAGSTVQAGVIDIDIEFNEALMQSPIASGSDIQIVNETTKELQSVQCVTVNGAHLTARAALYFDGPATLTWRTVADDGHPISESYTFNVSNPKGETQSSGGLCAVEKSTEMTATATDTTKKGNDGTGGLLGLGVGVAFIVVFSVIGGLQTKRRLDKEASKTK